MKIVIAMDSFKASIPTKKACQIVAQVTAENLPAAHLVIKPRADGGEGSLRRGGKSNNLEVLVLRDLEFDDTAKQGGVEPGISRVKGQEVVVRFENVSLVSGEGRGFEIRVEE